MKRLGIKVSKDILISQMKYPDGVFYPFKTSSTSSRHSNVINHKKGAQNSSPKCERPMYFKGRVYPVESDNSSDSDRVGPSKHNNGVNNVTTTR